MINSAFYERVIYFGGAIDSNGVMNKIAFGFLAASLLFAAIPSFATELSAPVTELPAAIIQTLNLEAQNGTCEESWPEYVAAGGAEKHRLSEEATLYLVPCAAWAHNIAWMAFVTIIEPKRPDGWLTLPMRFADYSPYEGLVARAIVHNIQWVEETQTLFARFYTNGIEQCGSAGEYVWNDGQRNLLLKTLLKQDICDGPPGPWNAVYAREK